LFLVQITRPAGFLAALLHRDAARLRAGDSDRGGASESWGDAYRSYRRSFEKLPHAREHLAIQEALKLIVEVKHGFREPQDAARQASGLDGAFGENLVIRLAHAVLSDMATTAGSPRTDPVARFGTMRATIDRAPPATRTTLHNAAFTRAWFGVLTRYTQRPDVAATWAIRMDHYQVDAHYAALAIVEKRLAALADALNERTFRDAAAECRSWLARVCEGLFEVERDAATRLFCADYLSGATSGRMAGRFAGLRADHRAATAAAPIDLTDPNKAPSIAPGEYRRAFRTLALSALLGIVAAGAALAFVTAAAASLVVGLSRSLRGAKDAPLASSRGGVNAVFANLAMGITPVVAYCHLADGRVFSEAWVYVIVLGVAGAAVSTTILFAQGARPAGVLRSGMPRIAAGMVAWMLPLLLVVAPPSSVAWLYRGLDRGVPAMMYIAFAMVGALTVGTLLLRPGGRDAMRISATAWLAFAVLAVGVHQVHRHADRRYQDAVVDGRSDELAAWLGGDWLSRYLAPSPAAASRPAP
jgi:hypothetical protein